MDATNWHEKIDDYLDGLLTETERADMDVALAQDPALARAVRLHRTEREALALLWEDKARAEFLRWTSDSNPNDLLPGNIPWWRKFRWPLLVSVVVLGLALWFWKFGTSPEENMPESLPNTPDVPKTETSPVGVPAPRNKPKAKPPIAEQTPQSQYKPDASQPEASGENDVLAVLGEDDLQSLFPGPDESTLLTRHRNNETESDKNFAEGSEAYKTAKSPADYQRVADKFGSIDSTERNFVDARYMQAHAFFKMRQYEAAAEGFRFVFDQRTIYHQKAKWKEALSLYGAFWTDLKQDRVALSACRSGTGPCGKYYDRLLESLRWVMDKYPPQAQNARKLLETTQKH